MLLVLLSLLLLLLLLPSEDEADSLSLPSMSTSFSMCCCWSTSELLPAPTTSQYSLLISSCLFRNTFGTITSASYLGSSLAQNLLVVSSNLLPLMIVLEVE